MKWKNALIWTRTDGSIAGLYSKGRVREWRGGDYEELNGRWLMVDGWDGGVNIPPPTLCTCEERDIRTILTAAGKGGRGNILPNCPCN